MATPKSESLSQSAAMVDIPSSSGSETSDVLDLRDDEGWEDAEPEEEHEQIISLFDDRTFSDVPSMLLHIKENYNFDFLAIRNNLALDFYGCIKLVNYIRTEVKAGRSVLPTISNSVFEHDTFLKPVLDDDALLFNLDDLPELGDGLAADVFVSSGNNATSELVAKVAELEGELRRTQLQFTAYRDTVKRTLDDRWNEGLAGASNSGLPTHVEKRDDDTHYFSSYSYNDIHEAMLKDTVRTDAYRDFIYENKHLFSGKVVLDVGCGTGILSLFCANAGAAQVIAVDNSGIIDKARENIFNNGFSDKITCLKGKIEEIVLPVEKVDIIVSEWMGYCLLYEAMFDSVIWARDRYLKPDGLMIPSHMNMWVAPVADPDYIADHFSFWRDVYGFDMKAMQAGIHADAQVLHMPIKTLCAEPYPFLQLSLHSTAVKDLVFKRKWESTLTADVDALDGFVIWFDTFFMPARDDMVPANARAEAWNSKDQRGVAFTTGPFGRETHWRQGIMFIENYQASTGYKAGQSFHGTLEYSVPEDNSRALDITMSWTAGTDSKTRSQLWKMR